MRLIHRVPFSQQEIELYRQLTFDNITSGLRHLLDAMDEFEIKVSEENISNVEIVDSVKDIGDGEPFPLHYIEPLKSLWLDPNVQCAYKRGNEAALPEKCVLLSVTIFAYIIVARSLPYFFSSLERVFEPDYQPTEQDIIMCRSRTIGITETSFHLRGRELSMADVGGQKSERRKWIHCFQDVTSILFLVSLSGYDQCLVEDKNAVCDKT